MKFGTSQDVLDKNVPKMYKYWDKTGETKTLVFATHGFVKKTSKVGKKEIDKAERKREEYFKNKKS